MGPWIMNIDLDYFFCAGPGDQAERMLTESYINCCIEAVRKKMEDGTIAVTTIALSPSEDLTGGWGPSEGLMSEVLSRLGIAFKLP
jgi:hypothetical protein